MKARNLALLAVLSTAIFYGITYSVAKNVMPQYISAYGFVWVRVAVTAALFWLTAWMLKLPKLEKKDFPQTIMLALFGVVLNILCFYKGLSLTTPINASVIMVITPILVLLFSLVILKDKFSWKQILGVFIGLAGAVMLTTSGPQKQINAENIPLGNLLVLINAVFYALYLILVKKMVHKYHPLVYIKWVYLFGLVMMTPFVYKDIVAIQWQTFTNEVWYSVVYVIVFATYLNYLFNLYGLKHLKPTTVSAFLYLQPVIAAAFAMYLGTDHLTVLKVVSSLLIFIGVYLASKKAKKEDER